MFLNVCLILFKWLPLKGALGHLQNTKLVVSKNNV